MADPWESGKAIQVVQALKIAQSRNREFANVTARETATWNAGVNEVTITAIAEDDTTPWSATSVGSAGAVTGVGQASVAGKSLYITSISAGYSAAAIGLLTLLDGATNIGNWHVNNQRDIEFPTPLKITAGNSITLALAAVTSVVGAITVTGFTRTANYAADAARPVLGVCFDAPSDLVADTWLTHADSKTSDSNMYAIAAGESRTFYFSGSGIIRLDAIRLYGAEALGAIVEAA